MTWVSNSPGTVPLTGIRSNRTRGKSKSMPLAPPSAMITGVAKHIGQSYLPGLPLALQPDLGTQSDQGRGCVSLIGCKASLCFWRYKALRTPSFNADRFQAGQTLGPVKIPAAGFLTNIPGQGAHIANLSSPHRFDRLGQCWESLFYSRVRYKRLQTNPATDLQPFYTLEFLYRTNADKIRDGRGV